MIVFGRKGIEIYDFSMSFWVSVPVAKGCEVTYVEKSKMMVLERKEVEMCD